MKEQCRGLDESDFYACDKHCTLWLPYEHPRPSLGQYKYSLSMSRVLLTPKWLARAPLWAFFIVKSLRGLLRMQSLFALKREPSCRVKKPKVEGFSTTSLKSSSSLYRALMEWNPRTLASRTERSVYLLYNELATTFSFPLLCLQETVKDWRSLTHLARLVFNLCWPLM